MGRYVSAPASAQPPRVHNMHVHVVHVHVVHVHVHMHVHVHEHVHVHVHVVVVHVHVARAPTTQGAVAALLVDNGSTDDCGSKRERDGETASQCQERHKDTHQDSHTDITRPG